MTKNQIEYNKLVETQRNNRVIEDLTRNRDLRAYEMGVEANVIQRRSVDEQARHNLEAESVARGTLGETIRSNKAREFETKRSNIAREKETTRANLAMETEAKRSHKASETETKRSDVAREKLQSKQISVSRKNVISQTRTQRAISKADRKSRLKDSREQRAMTREISYSDQALRDRMQLRELQTRKELQASENANRLAVQAMQNAQSDTNSRRQYAVGMAQASASTYGAQLGYAASKYATQTARQTALDNYNLAVTKNTQSYAMDLKKLTLSQQAQSETERHNRQQESINAANAFTAGLAGLGKPQQFTIPQGGR